MAGSGEACGAGAADVGRYGLWTGVFQWPDRDDELASVAREIEALGFDTIWLGQAGGASQQFDVASRILGATTRLVVATGVVDVWPNPVDVVAARWTVLVGAFPKRFLLGLGAGHATFVEAQTGDRYLQPLTKLSKYLDDLDSVVPRHQRVIAALGPRMLELARDKAAGAHPFNGTPAHTSAARAALGASALLAPAQRVVLCDERSAATAFARKALEVSLTLPNYQANWRRLGFDDGDFEGGGSDGLVDALVACGPADVAMARAEAHFQAGASHVAFVVTDTESSGGVPLAPIRRLADAFGPAHQARTS